MIQWMQLLRISLSNPLAGRFDNLGDAWPQLIRVEGDKSCNSSNMSCQIPWAVPTAFHFRDFEQMEQCKVHGYPNI